ncbi:MAG: sulfotransferase family 2 domain-containing protein [Chitinophagales bacterium]
MGNNIQLISLHIPKTAGTSFRNTLKDIYGEEAIIQLDIHHKNNNIKINAQRADSVELRKKHLVVHGHFSPLSLKSTLTITPDIPYITWLRDPVDRVISNYYYLEKRLEEELMEEAKGLNILSKMQRTLLEFAHADKNRNRISKFLEGMSLDQFLFVGITEHYSEDLKDLSELLGWKNFQEFHHNITGNSRKNVSQEDREIIRQLNLKDEELYAKALSMRLDRKSEAM